MSAAMSLADRAWDAIAPEVEEVAGQLWANPEPCLLERDSAALLRDWAAEHGFRVRDSASACDTAFVAEAGSGGPVVGILLEYDALPALGNVAAPRREPAERLDAPGHGCGHNFIGAVNAGAGIAAAGALREAGAAGRVVLYGTPAEEILFGKPAMLAAGDFEGVDVLLTHHPAFENAAVSRPCQAVVTGEFSFLGAPAHTGVPVSRNAQDAVELSIAIVERLRAHNFADVSIEHAQRAPMTLMPSNSPEELRCWWYIRHVDYARAEACYRWIRDVSETAARLCRVDVSDTVLTACRGYLPNAVLGRVLFEELAAVGAPRWAREDLEAMAAFGEAFDPASTFDLHTGVELLDEDFDRYGQDDGELSYLVPLGRYTWAFPRNVPFHSWAATAFFGTDLAWRGARPVGQALTRSTVRLATSPATVEEARSELGRRVPEPFARSMQGEWERLPAQAAAFWRGDWDLRGPAG